MGSERSLTTQFALQYFKIIKITLLRYKLCIKKLNNIYIVITEHTVKLIKFQIRNKYRWTAIK